MKKGLLITLTTLSISTIGIMSVSALTNSDTKIDILSKLTGKSNEEIIEEKVNENKILSEIAEENNVFTEFKEQTNNNKHGNRNRGRRMHKNCNLGG